MAYVTSDEFFAATEVQTTPDQLQRASLAVDRALIGALYDTDADSVPTNAAVLQAVKDATTAQARAIVAAEGAQVLKSASIGSASYAYADPIRGGITLPAGGGLCPDALAALQVAALLPVGVITYG